MAVITAIDFMQQIPPWLQISPDLFLNAMQIGGNIGLGQRRNDLEQNQMVLSSNEADQRNKNQAVAELNNDASRLWQQNEQRRQDTQRGEEFKASNALQRDVLSQRNEMQSAALDSKQQQNEAADALRASQLQNQLLMGQDRIQNTADRTGMMADAASGLNDSRQQQIAINWAKLDDDSKKWQAALNQKIPEADAIDWKAALDRKKALLSADVEGKVPAGVDISAATQSLDTKLSAYERKYLSGTSTGTTLPPAAGGFWGSFQPSSAADSLKTGTGNALPDVEGLNQPGSAPDTGSPDTSLKPNEVKRMTQDGRTAIFDKNTKQFIRYAQ